MILYFVGVHVISKFYFYLFLKGLYHYKDFFTNILHTSSSNILVWVMGLHTIEKDHKAAMGPLRGVVQHIAMSPFVRLPSPRLNVS